MNSYIRPYMQYFLPIRFFFYHIGGLIGLYYFWDPAYLLLSLFAYFLFSVIGFEISLHRYYAHKSFTCTPAVEKFLAFMSIFGGSSPVTFPLYHRTHHKISDQPGDPHMAGTSLFNVWIGYFNKERVKFNLDIIKDLKDVPLNKFLDQWNVLIYLIILALVAWVDLKFALYFFIIPGAGLVNVFSTENVICHIFGYRNHDIPGDLSRNTPWAVWLLGSQWHNNHHNRPWRYTFKEKPSEWDPAGWLIKHVFSTSVKE